MRHRICGDAFLLRIDEAKCQAEPPPFSDRSRFHFTSYQDVPEAFLRSHLLSEILSLNWKVVRPRGDVVILGFVRLQGRLAEERKRREQREKEKKERKEKKEKKEKENPKVGKTQRRMEMKKLERQEEERKLREGKEREMEGMEKQDLGRQGMMVNERSAATAESSGLPSP